ncbi:hypothetical protein [Actinoplanes utahensis]|uniref:Uncharacterized protein n=1 Tax=Actinoplanes utahensis TaxID=1869 RepID=A0A0A6UJI8_ACTUT|nr:hypothetical protein [Actinoplanes utahensis]KHD74479.1 hypothetical protein MB27_28585 [Actinoplanes utahensis]GIF31451.1 hypothetical protein Aut01nite_44370 [Actinoplanes utahensis]
MAGVAGLDEPTEASVIAELAGTVGAENAEMLWVIVCRRLKVSRPVTDPQHLIKATETLMELGDVLRVSGRSAKVRLITYRALEAALPG